MLYGHPGKVEYKSGSRVVLTTVSPRPGIGFCAVGKRALESIKGHNLTLLVYFPASWFALFTAEVSVVF